MIPTIGREKLRWRFACGTPALLIVKERQNGVVRVPDENYSSVRVRGEPLPVGLDHNCPSWFPVTLERKPVIPQCVVTVNIRRPDTCKLTKSKAILHFFPVVYNFLD